MADHEDFNPSTVIEVSTAEDTFDILVEESIMKVDHKIEQALAQGNKIVKFISDNGCSIDYINLDLICSIHVHKYDPSDDADEIDEDEFD